MSRDLHRKRMELSVLIIVCDVQRGVIVRFEIITFAVHWIVGRWFTISDQTPLWMAAENRPDASRHNRKRRHRRCARGIHDNVRKKIARCYQESYERCIRRRNVRNSRRALQYLQRLRNDARGISSKLPITKHKHLLKDQDTFEDFHVWNVSD